MWRNTLRVQSLFFLLENGGILAITLVTTWSTTKVFYSIMLNPMDSKSVT